MLTWVIGSGGLLGSSVSAALEERGLSVSFHPGYRLAWGQAERLLPTITAGLDAFLSQVAAAAHEAWAIVWCAGAAVVASPAADVDVDVAAWDLFLQKLHGGLAAHPSAAAVPGGVVLASSAGGVWGGHVGPPIDEGTPVRPISEYGRGHLARERTLFAFAASGLGTRAAVVRLSNLYGPGQRLDKPQGLISHIARSIVHRRPVEIYVSLDTVRDYLFAKDAGQGLVEIVGRLLGREAAGAPPTLKILASQEEISIGGLLTLFRRVTRRPVSVTAGLRSVGRLQPLHLRFRSRVWPDLCPGARTPLHHGIAVVFRRLHEQYLSGALAPPLA